MVVMLLVLLVLAGDAEAVTLVTPDGQVAQPYQRWADRAKVPTAPGVIQVVVGQCPGHPEYAGCYIAGEPDAIYLWDHRDPRDQLPRLSAKFVFFHEVGHVFKRRVLLDIRPDEWSPYIYATCALWKTPSTLGPFGRSLPSRLAYDAVCGQLRHAGGWYMRATSESGNAGSAGTARRARR